MGVAKSLETGNTGVILSYWRMNCVEVDIEANFSRCRVGGYIAKGDALAGKKAIENINYTFSGVNNPIGLMTNPLEYQNLLYAKIIAPEQLFLPNRLAGGEIVSDLP